MTYKNNKGFSNWLLVFGLVTVIAFTSVGVSATTPSFATNFSDIENHWAKSYIEMISKYDAISGYTDGTFKPNDLIQRIEFIAIIVSTKAFEVRNLEQGEYWGQPFIEAALENGLIDLNEYGDMDSITFDKNLSREEMASIVVRAYKQSGGTIDSTSLEDARSKLSDLDTVTPQYYETAVTSIAADFISGYSNGTFSPVQHANRAQASVISYKLLVKLGIIKDAELPENIIFSKQSLKQGELLKITVFHVDTPSTLVTDQVVYPDFKWVDTGDLIVGYIPTNYSTATGNYQIKFTNSETGNSTTKEITIVKRDFRVQNLTVATSVDTSTRTDDAYAQYYQYFNPSREISAPVKYYTESFILPTHGKITTEFGESRVVNGATTSYRHAGIDIAAPRNTNVLATNRGKVMLAMPLTLTGNSIVIDHGEGIFSVYFHLDQLFVAKDEIVERGQLIGAVGSTGFSTGPHLHFTMSYYRFNIEPGYLLYGQSITKWNYLELMK